MKIVKEALKGVSHTSLEDTSDLDVQGAVSPTYADAVVRRARLVKELEDKFKSKNKEAEDFIKDNHNTEFKPKGTEGMKKMKLSEALFEGDLQETLTYDEPENPGRGQCAPLVGDFTSDIKNAVAYLNDPEEKEFAIKQLKRSLYRLMDDKQNLDAFNTYWEARYTAMNEYVKSQLALIPEDVLNSIMGIDKFI